MYDMESFRDLFDIGDQLRRRSDPNAFGFAADVGATPKPVFDPELYTGEDDGAGDGTQTAPPVASEPTTGLVWRDPTEAFAPADRAGLVWRDRSPAEAAPPASAPRADPYAHLLSSVRPATPPPVSPSTNLASAIAAAGMNRLTGEGLPAAYARMGFDYDKGPNSWENIRTGASRGELAAMQKAEFAARNPRYAEALMGPPPEVMEQRLRQRQMEDEQRGQVQAEMSFRREMAAREMALKEQVAAGQLSAQEAERQLKVEGLKLQRELGLGEQGVRREQIASTERGIAAQLAAAKEAGDRKYNEGTWAERESLKAQHAEGAEARKRGAAAQIQAMNAELDAMRDANPDMRLLDALNKIRERHRAVGSQFGFDVDKWQPSLTGTTQADVTAVSQLFDAAVARKAGEWFTTTGGAEQVLLSDSPERAQLIAQIVSARGMSPEEAVRLIGVIAARRGLSMGFK
jgi:hypothetical protein